MQKKIFSGTAGWKQVYEYPYALAFHLNVICRGVFLALASRRGDNALGLNAAWIFRFHIRTIMMGV
jgi:hypothetical protein